MKNKPLSIKQINAAMKVSSKNDWDKMRGLFSQEDNPFLMNNVQLKLGTKKYNKLKKSKLWQLTKDRT